MNHAVGTAGRAGGGLTRGRVHRALWRWHFYAGLLSLPFLLLLAVTGGIYLFAGEIDRALHPRLLTTSSLCDWSPDRVVDTALAGREGWRLERLVTPAAPGRVAEAQFSRGEARLNVFIDPCSGKVTGTRPNGGPMDLVLRLHSLSLAGPWAGLLIEAAAGWVIVLFATGLYLWWPTRKAATVARGRGLWRKIHVWSGLGVGGVAVFLALTGLPWSTFWGARLHDLAAERNLGVHPAVWETLPTSTSHDLGAYDAGSRDPAPWVLENASRPASAIGQDQPLTFAQALRRAESQGLAPGFALEAPQGPGGVYTARAMSGSATTQRTIHFDQYSGAVVQAISFGDYGPIGQAVEVGIALHTGLEFGWHNKVVMLAGCIGLGALAISSLLLAWRRRGALLRPPPAEARSMRAVSLILVVGMLLFPVTALSAALIAAGDLAFGRLRGGHAT